MDNSLIKLFTNNKSSLRATTPISNYESKYAREARSYESSLYSVSNGCSRYPDCFTCPFNDYEHGCVPGRKRK